MKLIGAYIDDIKQMFLLEAAAIGFVGGVTGLFIGWLGTKIINLAANIYFVQSGEKITIVYVPLWLALFAVCFATAVGLLSGLYPAMRAAKMSPLKAIRQE